MIYVSFSYIKDINYKSLMRMTLSIRHLRTLLAIREHGSFSSAAAAVLVTHAAVSQQMKSLEAKWKITLFDRSSRSPQLTPLGHAFAAKAEAVIRSYDNMLAEITDGTGFAGDLGLGTVPTTLTGLIPLVVSKLKQDFCQLHVIIQPGLSAALLQQIGKRQIDAAIITRPKILPHGFNFQDIAKEPLELLAPPQTKSNDPYFLLKNYTFIRFDRNAIVGQMVEKWLNQNDLTVYDSMELEDLEAISSMVMANLGVSIVPKRCVRNMNPLPIKHISLGKNPPTRQLCLAYRNDNNKLDVIKAVHKTLSHIVTKN